MNFYIKSLCRPRAGMAKFLLVMKLIVLLLTAAILQVSATTYGQKVTINQKNMSLEQLFKQIRLQSGYDVLIGGDLIKNAAPVNVNVKDASIDQVMKLAMQGQNLNYTIKDKTIVIEARTERSFLDRIKETLNFPIRVDGRVTDSTGLALPGASVKVRDKVIRTDENGGFKISAEAGEEVTVSFVGYKPYSFKVAQDMGYQNIMLRSVSGQLQEVVVNTGYQQISKERSTGSYDFIDNKKFNEQVGTTVLDRLAGIANSVAYNKSATGDPVTGLTIRGISTINGERTPLIVVDNFPYTGDLNNLNPNDVESISILKDAAASSIWGARAGNGVIVITTKKGRYNQKMGVTINSNVSLITKPDLSTMRILSSSDLIEAQKKLFATGAYDGKEQDIYGRPFLPPVVELLIKERDHQISATDANSKIEAMKNYDLRNDAEKYLYRQGVNQQYALGISGGTDNIAYRLGVGYDHNIDNQDASFKRVNLSSLNTFRPFKDLELSAGLNITQISTVSGRPSYTDLTNYGMPIYGRLMDDQGQQIGSVRYRQPFIDTLGGGKLLDWHYYPLEDYKHSYSNQSQLDLTLNTALNYRVNRMLKLIIQYQYEKQRGTNVNVNDLQSYLARDMINSLTQISSDGSALIYPVPMGGINDYSNPSLTSHQVRGQVDFDHSWGSNQLVALAGAELRTSSSQERKNRVYGYDPNTSVTSPVDNVNVYTNMISGFGQFIPYLDRVSSQINRFVSVFAKGAYTYRNKYTISGSARRDASNIFGASTNNRWTPLWSAGAAWDINKEDFYHSAFLPQLRLRGSYGYSGNVNAKIVGITTVNYLGTDQSSQRPASSFLSFNNPDLRWENIATTNIALDFSTVNNRVWGSVEYFHKRTKDLYGPVPTDYTAVPTFVLFKNAASTAGNGIDLQLHSQNLKGQLDWRTDLNFTWYKDHVIQYYSNDTAARFMVNNGATLSKGGNNSVYGIYAYQWAGLNPQNGAPQGYLNGKVSTDYFAIGNSSYRNLVYYGSSTPTFFGNLGNTFQWHSLALTINLVYKLGYYFARQSINYSGLIDGSGNSDYAKRWQQPGDESKTSVPAYIYPVVSGSDGFYGGASVLVAKADNIRIDYIKLNYLVAPVFVKRIGLSELNVYVNARNFGPLWVANKEGIDPDNQSIKTSHVWSFGLNASF